MIDQLIQLVYLVATALFIFSLKWMSDPTTARRGVFAGVGGMALAIIGTMMHPLIIGYSWIAIPFVLGALAGVPLSWVPLTAVPQRTALSHAFGGLAAGLVGTAKYYLWAEHGELTTFRMGAIGLEVILGYLTCTGSLLAAGKLQEVIPTRPIMYRGQNVINFALLAAAIGIAIMLMVDPGRTYLFPLLIVLALSFGVLLVLPIGGADMPTVISLLNSYAGLAAVAMGFVMENKLLITAGALDGASGLILSIVMCRAMNRSFTNVLFGAFGQVQAGRGQIEQRSAKSATPEDAAQLLENASTVVIIPGYGMAVSQAQHRVHDLYEQLAKTGRRREVRDSSGGRPHARSHECAARRGRDSLRSAGGNGRHQSRDAARRCRAGHRRQRRRQSCRASWTRTARSTACPSSMPTRRRSCWRSSDR